MAVSLDALLNIRANVQGEAAVQKLGSAIGGIQGKAAQASGALKGLAASGGLAGGALGALLPLVSAAGLIGMAKNTLSAGNEMFLLSQKTGVSVEALARFRKAASTSGTDIDTVGKALGKLSKAMVSAQGGTGAAANTFRSLGVSVVDANGKLKSADEVMLRIADKFKTMPDGAQKTATAMALFGKAGAELIPMLDKGGVAIESMSVKMNTAFAERANKYQNTLTALGGKVGALGADIAIALLPGLQKLTNILSDGVTAFNSLDGNVKRIILSVALLVVAWGPLVALFGTIASIAGTIVTVFTAVGGAISSVAAAVPVLGGIGSVLGMIATGLAALVSWPVLIVAGIIAAVATIYIFRDKIGAFFVAIGKLMSDAFSTLLKISYDLFIAPYIKLWDTIRQPVMRVWSSIIDGVKGALRGLIGFWVDAINRVIGIANRGIELANKLPGVKVGLIGEVKVPKFAQGGFVTGPTLAMLGDNRSGREYAIPEEKMAGASMAYLSGARGADVLAGARGGAGTGGLSVAITTGPVMQLGGERYVTIDQAQQMVRDGIGATIRQLRTPAGRYATGVA